MLFGSLSSSDLYSVLFVFNNELICLPEICRHGVVKAQVSAASLIADILKKSGSSVELPHNVIYF